MTEPLILLIEDDTDIREGLHEVLEINGYQVRSSSHGQAALDLFAADPSFAPALIVLDLMMPVMDGWTFLEQRKTSTRLLAIPVIVLSAIDPQRLKAVEVTEVIKKPIDLDELIAAIKRVRSDPPRGRC